ncbi:MAG: hypothetical protein ACN2B6_08260 [Rickettsiales bacterium]
MPGRIFIESKPIPVTLGIYNHAYLVYEDTFGREFVIRGGPAHDSSLGDFRELVMESGVPIGQSKDHRHRAQTTIRGRKEIDLGGRDASQVWESMKETSQRVHKKGYPYEAISPNHGGIGGSLSDVTKSKTSRNSNSAVAFILESEGIDPRNNIPTNVSANDLPGIEMPLPKFENDDAYTPPIGVPDSSADNPSGFDSFGNSISDFFSSIGSGVSGLFSSFGRGGSADALGFRDSSRDVGFGEPFNGGFNPAAGGGINQRLLPSAFGLAQAILRSRRSRLEEDLIDIFTGGNGTGNRRGRITTPPFIPGSSSGNPFSNILGGIFDNMIGAAFSRHRSSSSSQESARSRDALAGYSQSQQAALYAQWLQRGNRNA